MKKTLFLLPIASLLWACTNEKEQTSASNATQQVQIIEESTKKLDDVMQTSEKKMDTLQTEIDELLNDI